MSRDDRPSSVATATTPDRSKKLIAAIQAQRRKVAGLADDDVWRDWLERETGARSLRTLTRPQLGRVIEALHRDAGGRAKTPYHPMWGKCLALWHALHEAGAIQSADTAALRGWFERQTGVSHERFAEPKHFAIAIEALKAWLARLRQQGGV